MGERQEHRVRTHLTSPLCPARVLHSRFDANRAGLPVLQAASKTVRSRLIRGGRRVTAGGKGQALACEFAAGGAGTASGRQSGRTPIPSAPDDCGAEGGFHSYRTSCAALARWAEPPDSRSAGRLSGGYRARPGKHHLHQVAHWTSRPIQGPAEHGCSFADAVAARRDLQSELPRIPR